MHHIPRWLYSPSKRKSTRMSSRRPRLERRNAAKNFNYEAPELHGTRSLDLSSELRSFRVEGSDDGELDRICRSLGLSGPEDFEIPVGVFSEASKKRLASDGFTRLRFSGGAGDGDGELRGDLGRTGFGGNEGGELDGVGDLEEGLVGGGVELDQMGVLVGCSGGIEIGTKGDRQMVLKPLGLSRIEGVDCGRVEGRGEGEGELSGNMGDGSDGVGGLGNEIVGRGVVVGQSGLGEMRMSLGRSGGIKGDRPPVLKPPPGMMIRDVDNGMSTWDLLKGFAPACETECSYEDYSELNKERNGKDQGCSILVKEEDVERGDGGSAKKGELDIVLRMGEMGIVSGSCSFTTSVDDDDDDDSSSSTTEPRSNNISPTERYERVITNWQKGRILGSGSFGSVYEGFSEDGSFFAVKEVSLNDQGNHGRQSIQQLEHEIALLSQFQHPNIVRYYGTHKDESKLYIFLELANQGSLADLYRKYTLRDSQVSGYTRQILLGLKYLHDQKVVHRDIKCANLLLDSSGSVKLADFGLAKAVVNDVKSCKGTAFWMAPEVVRGKGMGYGLPADIWSLGCTVLEMLTGHFPYHPLECMQAVFRVGRGEPPAVPESLSTDARNFILQCLRIKPSDRPTAAELLNHSFVRRPFPLSPCIGR